MVHRSREAAFAQEAFAVRVRRQRVPHDLEGHAAAGGKVLGFVNLAHAAPAQQAMDLVPAKRLAGHRHGPGQTGKGRGRLGGAFGCLSGGSRQRLPQQTFRADAIPRIRSQRRATLHARGFRVHILPRFASFQTSIKENPGKVTYKPPVTHRALTRGSATLLRPRQARKPFGQSPGARLADNADANGGPPA